jgi:hypothetical protein
MNKEIFEIKDRVERTACAGGEPMISQWAAVTIAEDIRGPVRDATQL